MCHELELTKINRLKIANAFRAVSRVDMSIPCVVEGQMGQAFVDALAQPTIYHGVIGPFHYFAGPSDTPQAQAMIADFPAYNLLMPSSPGWADLARQQFGDGLKSNTRHSFSSDSLNAERLNQLLNDCSFEGEVMRIDTAVAHRLSSKKHLYFDLADFDSAEDFATRGLGFVAMVGEKPVGIAYSSLVCSQGIEVSIFVDEGFRRQGVATAVAVHLLLACLARGLHPNWDAANPESVRLATKLGYRSTGSYEAYFLTHRA